MGGQNPAAPQPAANSSAAPAPPSAPLGGQLANTQSSEQARTARQAQFPYKPQPKLAAMALGAAVFIMLVTGIWCVAEKTKPCYSGGSAPAAVGILLVLALVLDAPTLILDDSPEEGGEPSTMRILSLAIVLAFCMLMLRNGWNNGSLPSLENQGNWVWLVTAALGGKALQKFAEVQEKK
jgi:hypothetical protein